MLIAVFGLFLGAILGLGVLRFHASRLAYHLNSINHSIQQYANEETALRQELSALVAPIKIYGYCKENLGLQKVANAEVLTVRSSGERVAVKEKAPAKKGWRVSLAWLLGE